MYARDTALIATPIGGVLIEGDSVVTAIRIGVAGPKAIAADDAVRCAAEQLEQFFAGERSDFALRLAPLRSARGEALRAAIVAVGYAETARYGELAQRIGSSARAIGQACRTNPFPIVVPCHRVLGGAGHYSAGDGLVTKNWLLDHEQRHRHK